MLIKALLPLRDNSLRQCSMGPFTCKGSAAGFASWWRHRRLANLHNRRHACVWPLHLRPQGDSPSWLATALLPLSMVHTGVPGLSDCITFGVGSPHLTRSFVCSSSGCCVFPGFHSTIQQAEGICASGLHTDIPTAGFLQES